MPSDWRFPQLLAARRVDGLQEVRVGAAGEHDALIHRRRRVDPRDVVIHAPAKRARHRVDGVEESVARANVHDAAAHTRRRLNAATVEAIVAGFQLCAFGVVAPNLLARRHVERVDTSVKRADVRALVDDCWCSSNSSAGVGAPEDRSRARADAVEQAVAAAEQHEAIGDRRRRRPHVAALVAPREGNRRAGRHPPLLAAARRVECVEPSVARADVDERVRHGGGRRNGAAEVHGPARVAGAFVQRVHHTAAAADVHDAVRDDGRGDDVAVGRHPPLQADDPLAAAGVPARMRGVAAEHRRRRLGVRRRSRPRRTPVRLL